MSLKGKSTATDFPSGGLGVPIGVVVGITALCFQRFQGVKLKNSHWALECPQQLSLFQQASLQAP